MSHPIENIMQSSMEHVKKLADVNTVIGTPIMAEGGTMILPVSKVSLGMLVGGGEYMNSTPVKRSAQEPEIKGNYPFIGASAVGMSLTPLAFLSVREGSVRVLPAKQDCAADRIVDLIPQMIETAERLIRELAEGNEKCRCEENKGGRSSANGRSASAEDTDFRGRSSDFRFERPFRGADEE